MRKPDEITERFRGLRNWQGCLIERFDNKPRSLGQSTHALVSNKPADTADPNQTVSKMRGKQ